MASLLLTNTTLDQSTNYIKTQLIHITNHAMIMVYTKAVIKKYFNVAGVACVHTNTSRTFVRYHTVWYLLFSKSTIRKGQ